MRVLRYLLTPRSAVVLGLGYALTLLGVDAALNAAPARTRDGWLLWCSTNLDNLASHPVGALLASAVVTQDDPLPWAALALVALWAAVRVLDAVPRRAVVRTIAVVLGVHVLATGVSQGILARRIAVGDEPASARHLIDIGPSYLVVAALVVVLVAGRGLERMVCAAGFVVVAPSLFDGLSRWDVTAVGHTASVLLAACFGLALRRQNRGNRP